MNKIIIAIDGHAGCGKSTTAKLVAKELGYTYIDSGAMYRAVALYFLKNGIPFEAESPEMKEALDNIYIDFIVPKGSKSPATFLNGENVEEAIRSPQIADIVSQVSVHRMVRKELVSQQQRMGRDKGIVMDGRDIGTVVFPEAELKIFMTADQEIRAERRRKELESRQIQTSTDQIIHNLRKRDLIDSTRKTGPLKQATDAIVIDTTDRSIAGQVREVVTHAQQLIAASGSTRQNANRSR